MGHPRKPVDRTFFDNWSDRMAYVLGYFAADGTMFVNTHDSRYVAFVSTERVILRHVKTLLSAKHRITLRRRSNAPAHWKPAYQLQIGGGGLFESLSALGFTPNKSNTMRFPNVPAEHLASFVRGYFDGDGCISIGWYQPNDRRSRKRYIQCCFVSGSFDFLRQLDAAMKSAVGIQSSYLRKRPGEGSYLYYQRHADLNRLHAFLYPDGLSANIYLARKRRIFDKAIRILGT